MTCSTTIRGAVRQSALFVPILSPDMATRLLRR